MIRILLDQGLPRRAVTILSREQWDVVHTGDVGLAQASDREIIEYARIEDRIIVTLDADFHAMLAVENASSPSVIRIRQEGLKSTQLSDLIKSIWPTIQSQLNAGALVTVTAKSIRVRSIPLIEAE